MFNAFKGALQASFMVLMCMITSYTSANETNLDTTANDPQWQALLHIYEEKPLITQNFLLSAENFSAKNELVKTLQLFQSNHQQTNACHYIARHYYLSVIKGFKLPAISCPDFQDFTQQVPADHVSILFASENLSQPASIMGHTMMALSDEGFTKQHSVSFFTELTSVNPVSLIWDNFITGQPGFFLVQPLQKNIDLYLEKEQRNIWRYQIKLSHEQKMLFLAHLWELKFASLDYFFHSHNCATLTLDILRIINPKLLESRQNWVSPIDVVKAADKQNMLTAPMLYGSSKWKIRLLSDYVKPISEGIFIDESKPKTVLAGLLSFETNAYRYQQGDISQTDWFVRNTWLKKQGLSKKRQRINFDNPKNPLHTPDDSQWGIQFVQNNASYNQQTWGKIYWMPASHDLMDDNSQYSSENQLKILQVSARYRTNNLQLDSLHIYNAESYLNVNEYIGGLSGRIALGIGRFPIKNSFDALASYAEGAIGKSYQLHKDLSVYGLVRLGLTANQNNQYIKTGPEVGLFFHWVGGMKTHLKASQLWRTGLDPVEHISFKHTLLNWKKGALKLSFDQQNWQQTTSYESQLGFSFYY